MQQTVEHFSGNYFKQYLGLCLYKLLTSDGVDADGEAVLGPDLEFVNECVLAFGVELETETARVVLGTMMRSAILEGVILAGLVIGDVGP